MDSNNSVEANKILKPSFQLKKKIFNINIVDKAPEGIIKLCNKRLKNNKKTFIITLNSLMVLRYYCNRQFQEAIKRADIIFADGYGIILASKIFNNEVKNHIPGIDFIYKLLGWAFENKLSVFLLGSRWEVVDKTCVNLKKWFTSARFLGKYSGFFSSDEEPKIIEGINKVAPDILFVGMGSPRQEIWISRNIEKLKAKVIIGIGGSFDVLSGYKKRAPALWRERNLEWLYRSFTAPGKLFNIFKIGFYFIFIFYYKFFLLHKENKEKLFK